MAYPYQLRTREAYEEAYRQSIHDPERFWGEIARHFQWQRPFYEVLRWNFREPSIRWFEGGQLNITENALDRWAAVRGNTPALIWEANDPQEASRTFTYRELLEAVCRCCHVLKKLGVRKGDRVCLYMPMIPELAIAVLACARMGAIHSVIFGGFSAQSIADRILDAGCKLVVTADGNGRFSRVDGDIAEFKPEAGTMPFGVEKSDLPAHALDQLFGD